MCDAVSAFLLPLSLGSILLISATWGLTAHGVLLLCVAFVVFFGALAGAAPRG